ncbi:hypothetical protein ACWC5I_22305 [Kitasatospora sp. NPDC001574]
MSDTENGAPEETSATPGTGGSAAVPAPAPSPDPSSTPAPASASAPASVPAPASDDEAGKADKAAAVAALAEAVCTRGFISQSSSRMRSWSSRSGSASPERRLHSSAAWSTVVCQPSPVTRWRMLV